MNEPMRVTAKLLTGKLATIDLYVPLDGILAYAWMRENRPERLEISSSGVPPADLVEVDLPLERRGTGEDWYWACSFACGKPLGEEIVYWHKRFDTAAAEMYADFQGRRGKVETGAGPYKSFRHPMVTYLLPELTWYAVGDIAGVQQLLCDIAHIGKGRGQGYGRVAHWHVEPWAEDLSHLRAIPDPGGTEMGIRPPYWLPWQWRRARVSPDLRLACNAVRVVA